VVSNAGLANKRRWSCRGYSVMAMVAVGLIVVSGASTRAPVWIFTGRFLARIMGLCCSSNGWRDRNVGLACFNRFVIMPATGIALPATSKPPAPHQRDLGVGAGRAVLAPPPARNHAATGLNQGVRERAS